jgi:peroxiredoxin
MRNIILFALPVLLLSCHPTSRHSELESLQVQLDAKRASATTPDEIREVMKEAKEKLYQSDLVSKAVKHGDQYIDFELPNARGGNLKISEVLKRGPVILTFYRGSWCPYCNLQLRAYQKHLAKFEDLGASVIAISPEKADLSKAHLTRDDLKFDVLTDQSNVIARKYGLVFKIEEKLKEAYLSMGLDLEKNQGNNNWELPIGATYVILPDGKIAYSFLNVDYTQRAEPQKLLDVLRASQKN